MANSASAHSTTDTFDSAAVEKMLEDLTQQILDEAKRQGATAAEAGSSIEDGFSTTVRMGELETIEHHRDRGMGVTVFFGHKKGTASTSDFSPQAVKEAVEAACNIAKYTEEDSYAGLIDPERMANEVRDLQLEHDWEINVENSEVVAQQCEAAARAFDPRITNSDGASVNSHKSVQVYGNSHGFIGGYCKSRHSLTCAVIAEDESGMEQDYWYFGARNPAQLPAAEVVGRKSAELAIAKLGARSVGTCQVPVIFDATVASELIGSFLGAIRGSSLYRKTSFLLDHLGEQIFPEFIRISEEPHRLQGLASAPFDNEGAEVFEKDFVTDGRLVSYLLDSYSARRLKMEPTGNAGGARNVNISHGDKDLPQLLQQMQTGFLVTDLMGHGVNALTGDYSRGASGFWVKNGEIAYPVSEVTIASNLKEMFKQIVEVGNDIDRRGNIQSGSILIEQMSVAGQ